MSIHIDTSGWSSSAQRIPSPNCDARPAGADIELVVIHAISLPPEQFGGPGIEQLFTNTLSADDHPYYASIHQLRVSAHFLIRRDGRLLQFAPTLMRAWHAGVSSWQGRERCNDFSIGIELEGCDRLAFRVEQYECLADLILALQVRHPIRDLVGHSDVAPGRKTDPGPCFEWARLRALLASRA